MGADRDLVEPEGVNAASDQGIRERPGGGDPVPGGAPERAEEQQRPEPSGHLLGSPADPDMPQAYGSEPVGNQ